MATRAERLTALLAERDERIDQAINFFEEQTYRTSENIGRRVAQALGGNAEAVREPDGDDGVRIGQTRIEQKLSGFSDLDQLQAVVLDLPVDELDEFMQAAGLDLRDQGVRDVVADLAGYAEETLFVQGRPTARGVLDTVAAEALLDSYMTTRVDGTLSDVIDGPIRQRLRDGLTANLGSMSTEELAGQLIESIDGTVPQAMTEANTMIAAADRFVDETVRTSLETEEDAEPGEQYLIGYIGPDDRTVSPRNRVIRPFCSHMVGKAFKLIDLKKADNAQGLNVRLYGGGWNCRHRLVPVINEPSVLKDLKLKVGKPDDVKKANDAAKGARRKSRRRRRS